MRAIDADGRPVSDVTVGFSTPDDAGSFSPARRVTDERGEASAAWSLGPRAGAVAGTARLEGVSIGALVDLTATAIPGPADPSTSTLSASPTTFDTRQSSTIRVTARDAFGNAVPGVAVDLGVSGSGNIVSQPSTTDENGVSTATLQSHEVGEKTVSAQVAGVTLEQTVTLNVALPVVGSISIDPGQAQMLAGQTTTFVATVHDEQGTPIDGAQVDWKTSNAEVATVGPDGSVTGRSPGGATITAASNGRSAAADVTVSYGEGMLSGLTYCTIDGSTDLMDVYVPGASKPRPLPVAVHVHGGGWTGGSRALGFWFQDHVQALLERGYLVVSLDYRLAPLHKYPAQIQDVKCAIRHLRANALIYGLDPDRIGAWGESAGGQLVALMGTADASAGFDQVGGFQGVSSEVQAVIAQSAITDFTRTAELRDNYSREFLTWPDPGSSELIEASPVSYVTGDDPPFFFIVGDEDTLVLPAQSLRMHEMLIAAGVESSLLTIKHANHGLTPTTAPIDPTSAAIIRRMVDFFDRHLR